MKIAVLSNVNLNATVRMLQQELEVYDNEGYGNELGTLLNPDSSLRAFEPNVIFIIEDLLELLDHELDLELASLKMEQWFSNLESGLIDTVIYYISDAYLWGCELAVQVDCALKQRMEYLWLDRLKEYTARYQNVRIFPYRQIIENMGTGNAFSAKTWYMGKIMHSMPMQQQLCQTIKHKVELESVVPKKVLLLDLDNTLWGGLAGENNISPIVLSDEHSGLIYKNLQRVISQMKNQGVILAIVSKNNEDDVFNIFNNHPHMILKSEDFAVKKINWSAKYQNIKQIASELNLGLDSMVFFDDNPVERQAIHDLLPQVCVPDFPDKPDDLPNVMISIWQTYFDRVLLTEEDYNKTKQYSANVKREELKKSALSFEDYLKNLKIKLTRKKSQEHLQRITQLINKTNQFNLTTHRHTQNEIQEYLYDSNWEIFSYQVQDCFGDSGIVAVVIVDKREDVPVICEFVMSCRIMGRNIENAIIEDVENVLISDGYSKIRAEYIASVKNKPVEKLYDSLGYVLEKEVEQAKYYKISAADIPKRNYRLEKIIER